LTGKVRFGKTGIEARVEGKTIMEHADALVKDEIRRVWKRLSD